MVDTRLLVGLVLSLLLSSLAISFVVSEDPAELGSPYTVQATNVSFTTNTSDRDYYTASFIDGFWKLTDNGLVSDSSGTNTVYFTPDNRNNRIYDNEYYIVNPDLRPYSLIIRDTNLYLDSIFCTVSTSGITVKSGTLIHTPFMVTVPGNFVGGRTAYRVRTVYDPTTNIVGIYIDGEPVATVGNLPEDSVLSYGKTYYAGLEVEGSGFIIKQYSSTGKIIQSQDADLSFSSFMGSLASVLVWYTSSGFWLADLLINLIIKIQQFAIVAVLITLIRGA